MRGLKNVNRLRELGNTSALMFVSRYVRAYFENVCIGRFRRSFVMLCSNQAKEIKPHPVGVSLFDRGALSASADRDTNAAIDTANIVIVAVDLLEKAGRLVSHIFSHAADARRRAPRCRASR